MFCCQLLILAYEKVIMRKGIWIAKKFQLVSYYFNYAMKSAISLPVSKVTYGKLFRDSAKTLFFFFLYSFYCISQIYHPFCMFKTSCRIISIHALFQQYLSWCYDIPDSTYYPYFQGTHSLFWERKYTEL